MFSWSEKKQKNKKTMVVTSLISAQAKLEAGKKFAVLKLRAVLLTG